MCGSDGYVVSSVLYWGCGSNGVRGVACVVWELWVRAVECVVWVMWE